MSSESQTRRKKIDLQLGRAGWSVGSRRLIEELLIETSSTSREPEESFRTSGFADYGLMDHFSRPLAIVEAKRSSRDPLEGERQAADYADALLAKHGIEPFIFLANGNEIWFLAQKALSASQSQWIFSRGKPAETCSPGQIREAAHWRDAARSNN